MQSNCSLLNKKYSIDGLHAAPLKDLNLMTIAFL